MQRLLARAPGHGARRLTPLGLLPEGPPALALSLALNAGLALGLVAREALAPLAGRTVALQASDLGARVRLAYDGARFCPGRGAADVTVRSTASGFLALALRREDPDALFFTRRLLITGDTDLGLVVKNALDAIDWSRLPLPGRR